MDLFESMFSSDGLRVFLKRLPDGATILAELPSGSAAHRTVVAELVAALMRRKRADPSLFEELAGQYPARRAEIEQVAVLWSPAHKVAPNAGEELAPTRGEDADVFGPEKLRSGVRWLHLTDLQIGAAGHSEPALRRLVDALHELGNGAPFDAVVISGNLAWSADTAEYARFREDVYAAVRASPAFAAASWYLVPGSRDLDCYASFPPVWENLGERRLVFFDESAAGRAARAPRARSFESFEETAQLVSHVALRPSEQVSQFASVRTPHGELGLVLTNTAWFSDKDTPSGHKLPAPLASITASIREAADSHVGFVIVGHHSLDDFRYEDREQLRALLVEHRAVYLHGHSPRAIARHSRGVLQAFGFGADAPARPPGAAPARSASRFAVYTLNRELCVSLFACGDDGVWRSVAASIEGLRPEQVQPDGSVRFQLPWQQGGKPVRGAVPPAGVAIGRLSPAIAGLSCLNVLRERDWATLIERYHLLDTRLNPENSAIEEHNDVRFWYEADARRHMIVCLAGSGRVLSESQVLDANTQLDLEDFASYTIITFGELAEEARTAYVRLRTKKPLAIVDRQELLDRIYARFGARTRQFIEDASAPDVEVRIIMLSADAYILLSDKVSKKWIELYDESCVLIPDGDSVVTILRESRRTYAEAFYGRQRVRHDEVAFAAEKVPVQFDAARYREALFEEFNGVRYAPLAAFGLRFSGATLSDLYVETNAQIEESHSSDAQLARALDEIIDGKFLDANLRQQLRQQMSNAFKLQLSGENDIARKLYQRHGNLLVLGTPGSGKTLFVKRELLAYCRPPAGSAGWYGRHVPLLIPLAEAARAAGDAAGRPLDLLAIAASLPRRESTAIPEHVVRELYAEGQLALFFDGLDEVTSLAQRSAIADALGDILSVGRSHGNRVVITSRPSAVQVIDLAPDLPSMTLCGLDEGQIKTLARRVLRLSVSEGKAGVQISEEELQSGDIHLMERLIHDIEGNVGIRRLATNPLLLTLLLMVYMNSGAPSAKRHKIYQQAVQTLVTIRSRDTGQEVLPESDLRRRLGAVALSVFKDGRSAIPSLKHVLQVIQASLTKDQGRRVTDEDARAYLQHVADSTGIIVLHPAPSDPEFGSVTFMHYSFAEYYAAVGLDASGVTFDEVAKLAQYHRWRETITLYAGLLGDYGDLHAFIGAVLRGRGPADDLTLDLLLFAFDCALESDVPPESVQELLLQACEAAVKGILRHDRQLRLKLAERLQRLYRASRSRLVSQFLNEGFKSPQPETVAAYVDIFAVTFDEDDAPPELLRVFEAACGSAELPVIRAICRSAQVGNFARHLLACPAAAAMLSGALTSSSAYQAAALQCLEFAPQLVDRFRREVERAMRDDSAQIYGPASRAYLGAYANKVLDDELYRHLMLEAMRNLARSGGSIHKETGLPPLDRRVIERLLSSAEGEDRELGLYLIPWLKGEEQFAYDRALEVIGGSDDRSMLVAALTALRAQSARRLIRLADLAELRKLVESRHRDVSLAAIRALADVGRRDSGTISTLIEATRDKKGEDFREIVRFLAYCGNDNGDVREFLCDELTDRLPSVRGAGAVLDVRQLLVGAASCDWSSDPRKELWRSLRETIDNPRKDEALRVDCIQAFVAVCKIGPGAVDQIIGWMGRAQHRRVRLAGIAAAEQFLRRCRLRFEFISLVYPKLPALREELLRSGQALVREKLVEQEVDALTQLRSALEDLDVMMSAFREFDV